MTEKPRLVHGDGRWFCYNSVVAGRGATPRAAWEDWVRMRIFMVEMEMACRFFI